MTNIVIKHVEPWRSLDYFNTVAIPQGEATFGPLLTIDHDSNTSLLSFTFSTDDAPVPNAVIAPDEGGKPVIPDGATLIDEGVIFVEGVLVLSAATRSPKGD